MQVGDEVDFLGMKATIRYIGTFHGGPGTWIGAELPLPKGKNNGTIKGVKYFTCPENHGVFAEESAFKRAVEKSKKLAKSNQQTSILPKSSSTPVIETGEEHKLSLIPKPSKKSENKISKISNKQEGPKIENKKPEEEKKETPQRKPAKSHEENEKPKKSLIPVLEPKKETVKSETSSSKKDAEKNVETGDSEKIINTPKPQKVNQNDAPTPIEHSSSQESIDDEVEELKNKTMSLKQIFLKEQQNYREAKAETTRSEENYNNKIISLKTACAQKLQKIEIETMQKSIAIEEETLETILREKELKKVTVSNAALAKIESLQRINDEHNLFEKELREVSRKFAGQISKELTNKNTLEKKLFKYQQIVQSHIDNENMLRDEIKQLEEELDSQKPAIQESNALNFQLNQLTEFSSHHEERMERFYSQQKLMNEFAEKLIPHTKPVFMPLLLVKRILQKVAFLGKSPTNELLLHFCECAELFLSKEISDADQIDELLSELKRIESEINQFKQPNVDIDNLNKLMQKLTPEPLNQAITSQLVMAYALCVDDDSTKADLLQIAKQIKGVIHPSNVTKNKDEVETLAFDLINELRKAKKGQKINIDGIEQKISIAQMGLAKPPELDLFIGPSSKDEQSKKYEEDPEVMELRRRLRDAEALIKTYNRHINYLEHELTV